MKSVPVSSIGAPVEKARAPHAWWPLILALLTALAGTVITLMYAHRLMIREGERAQERFRLEAQTLRMNAERELALFVDVLDSIRALHGLSGEISAEALDEFVARGMQHQQSVLGAFGFAQGIHQALRVNLERAHAESPDVGYRLVERGPDGTWAPAGQRLAYFPLTWVSHEVESGLKVPIGYDFASHTAARHAIERMQQQGGPAVVTEPVEWATDRRLHWVFSPIFFDATGLPRLVGFAIGLLEPEAVMRRVADLAVPSPGLQLQVRATDPGTERVLVVEERQGYWIYRAPIQWVDRVWTFEVRIPAAVSGRTHQLVRIAGLLVTLLMTSQLLLMASRTRAIEREVAARTRDVELAKGQLEIEMQERLRLEDEMRDLATRERQRLGRDLHDSLGQKLTGAVFLSRSLVRHFQGTGVEQAAHARTLNDTLKEAVGQVRAMARGLAPVTLNDESLAGALAQLAEEMTDLYGVSCECQAGDDGHALPPKVKEQLYFIAREAVNNAARHARPQKVTIQFNCRADGDFQLVVEDDGCGMPEDQRSEAGLGLRIMPYRAGMIGAAWRIESRPGGGTRVICASASATADSA